MLRNIGLVTVLLSMCLLPASAGDTYQIPTAAELLKLVNDQDLSAKMAANDPVNYGWNIFFYANWPALDPENPANRGKLDPDKPFGGPGTTVWETWKNTDEVFLRSTQKPPVWATAEPVPEAVQKASRQPNDSGNVWEDMTGDTQVDGFNVKDSSGKDILYEIRMNRPTFEYIRNHDLYYIQGQQNQPNVWFPWNAMEAKSAWRWLDPVVDKDKIPYYFTANGYWAVRDKDGNFLRYETGLMGLTGLHLITKALDQWVWLTFEQINNDTWTKAPPLYTPILPEVKERNTAVRASLKAIGSKWQYYRMIGVQISPSDSSGKPILLANTQLESAFQSRSSCLTCHGIANIGKFQDSLKPIRKSFVEPGKSPPYYVGPVPDLAPYYSQDFVWSLRRAFWRESDAEEKP